ncbi:MAG: hydroxyacylglutathione hydrolase [Gloeomargarita sp. SKYBB_i_bin120]|nr:hydroxyacylglutathione hydrolase [Gloeomargarita sp. SKYG98]MCS7292340.1 hydroxyacylglutathione hydrolase [Gloeomargarita sp. SKYB120]MDW8177900.1 hydroxyacylglutathione hydrolase [Gloeomargarita sp. SKYBB_i_bin120]
MHISRLPALRDNYIFVLWDQRGGQAAVVDPAEPAPVLDFLQAHQLELTAIFNTHHHGDHVGANLDLLAHFPNAVVYGGAQDQGRIPGQTVYLAAGDTVQFAGRRAEILFVPGHTKAHIAYYFLPTADQPGDLFIGDTLFSGGCGRLFEGTPAQMLNSLAQLRPLPDDTRVWCAHEYTQNNLRFALTVEPDNTALRNYAQQVQALRQKGEATIPSTLGLEKQINPFLRWDVPAIQRAVGSTDPVTVFARLRARKDHF